MEQWLDEPNKVYESSKLSDESLKIIEYLKSTNLSVIYQFEIDCMNIEHVDFAIKSHYMLGQISVILDHIKVGDAFYGVNNGSILFECMFTQVGDEFKLFELTDDGFNNIENLF